MHVFACGCVCVRERVGVADTYVLVPGHFVRFRVGRCVALEVYAVALFDVVGIQRSAHFQRNNGHICEWTANKCECVSNGAPVKIIFLHLI